MTAHVAWHARYEAMARLLYDVRRLCPQLPVLGVSLLHPRHSLPADQLTLLSQLDAADGTRAVPSLPLIAARWLWCVAFACRDTVKLFWMRLRCRRALAGLMRRPAQVVFKTWRFTTQPLDGSPDFYYGTLPRELAERGISGVVLYGDGSGRIDRRFAAATLHDGPVRGLPEQLLIPLWAPLAVAFRQWAAALALRRLARRVESDRLGRVCAAAAVSSVQPYTMRNTLYYYIAKQAVRIWRPSVFVTLYEGQPWEVPAWQGAKAANPSCLTVGYQHTVILPHSLSVLSPHQKSWERSSPDVVLCLGEATRSMMREGHRPSGNQLVVFGSYRRAVAQAHGHAPEPVRRTVLVLPEGILAEARILFDFAMRAAEQVPDHQFIFRCHPVLPFDVVRPHLADAPERHPNITISREAAITADFDRSSVVLYRASSAVLYAVLHGLRPVYLHDERHPDVDPLFEVTSWKDCVASPEELEQALRRAASTDGAEATVAWRPAADYIERYTRPVDQESVDQLLSAVGLAKERLVECAA